MFIINFYLNMFWASLCPSSGEQRPCYCIALNTLRSCDRASLAKYEERETKQDATIRCLLLTSVSTCFGHHYAHLQEPKEPVTAFGILCGELVE